MIFNKKHIKSLVFQLKDKKDVMQNKNNRRPECIEQM